MASRQALVGLAIPMDKIDDETKYGEPDSNKPTIVFPVTLDNRSAGQVK